MTNRSLTLLPLLALLAITSGLILRHRTASSTSDRAEHTAVPLPSFPAASVWTQDISQEAHLRDSQALGSASQVHPC